ncbi:MAG: poly(A) polymerase, partial [Betaproteobacteria bacterium]|nr:poly(A) polymerase [Betaproteobacteria bacterium]
VRLSASRGLEIDQSTREPIKSLTPLLANVPPARLFDELLKLLLSGHAYECVMALRHEGLHHGLLPMLDVILDQPMGERFVMMSLRNTDARIKNDKSVSPAFLFASLLWHEVLAGWKKLEADGMPQIPALFQAMDEVIQSQAGKLAIPRRYSADMKEIWVMQPRFLQRNGRRPYRLIENPRFRAGYDFLLLRCASGEVDPAVGEWWTRFQHGDETERRELLAQLTNDGAEPAKRKRRRRRKRTADDAPEAGGAEPS